MVYSHFFIAFSAKLGNCVIITILLAHDVKEHPLAWIESSIKSYFISLLCCFSFDPSSHQCALKKKSNFIPFFNAFKKLIKWKLLHKRENAFCVWMSCVSSEKVDYLAHTTVSLICLKQTEFKKQANVV